MNEKINVEYLRGFKGKDVVHLKMNANGLDLFYLTLSNLRNSQVVNNRFQFGNQEHFFFISKISSYLYLKPNTVEWYLTETTLKEILEKLEGMKLFSKPSHNYIDIDMPAKTLFLSNNEYP